MPTVWTRGPDNHGIHHHKTARHLVYKVQAPSFIPNHGKQSATSVCPRTVEVGPSQWKTALINIQLSGRLAFFKTISKQEDETRTGFRAVSDDLEPFGSELAACPLRVFS